MSYIYLPEFLLAEQEVAERLLMLRRNKCEKLPPLTQGLVHNQPEAVVNACENSFSIITGCAGTGKTTTLKKVIDSFEEQQMSGVICCPTGKAAKRAYQVVNADREVEVPCKTAHRMLGYSFGNGSYNFGPENPLDLDYVVVDEFSMCDIRLLRSILAAIDPARTRLILCGDPFQLPSVAPGNIGRDIIMANLFPSIRLNKIIRQGADSGIVYNSHRILKGEKMTEVHEDTGEKFTDFFLIKSEAVEESHDKIVQYATKSLQERRGIKPQEVQIISPGKKGAIGVDNLNKSMRNTLNRSGKEQHGYRVGDKVLVTRNNYQKDVVNGDIGYVKDVNQAGVEVDIDGGSVVSFTSSDLSDLRLAYAFTIHKSQGSEFRAVIYPVHTTHWKLHSRNLLYTGVTRGKEIVVLIGDKKSIAYSVKNNQPIKRCTRLKTLLLKEADKAGIKPLS